MTLQETHLVHERLVGPVATRSVVVERPKLIPCDNEDPAEAHKVYKSRIHGMLPAATLPECEMNV